MDVPSSPVHKEHLGDRFHMCFFTDATGSDPSGMVRRGLGKFENLCSREPSIS